MQKIVIIGGFGFIAKNLVETLREQYEFVLLDRNIDVSFAKEWAVDAEQCDILKEDVGLVLEKYTPEFIINTVSVVTAARDLSLFSQMVDTNLKVLLKLYEAIKSLSSLKAFVQFGSAEEYGPITVPFQEMMREYPLSPYALCKQITTNTTLMLHRNYGFPAFVIRPSNVFGKGQPADKFIPYIQEQLRNGKPLELTPCGQKRDFISAKSFAQALNDLLAHYSEAIGQVVNIGSGMSVSLREIVEYTRIYYGSSSEVHFGAKPYRENEMMDFISDISLLEHITRKPQKRDFWTEYKSFLG